MRSNDCFDILFFYLSILILYNRIHSISGIGAQSATDTATAAAAAAGLLPQMTVQNLAALAAITQPSLTAATQPTSAAHLSNAAALLCKYSHSSLNSSFLILAYILMFFFAITINLKVPTA